MSHYGQLAFVSFVNNRQHLIHRHLILIDQLDDVDSGFSERAHFGAGVFRTFDAPAKVISARIRLVLNKRSGDVKCWTSYLAFANTIADCETRFQWSAEIARAGYTRHQQLARGSRHNHRFHLRRISLVPMRVVAVTVDHQMDVHVP